MGQVHPLKVTASGTLKEFESGDYIGIEHGGLGVSTFSDFSFSSLTVTGNLNVSGNINISGTINGRDIVNDSLTFDAHISDTTSNPHNVTPTQVLNYQPYWNASSLRGKAIDDTTLPSDHQFLVYDATTPQWTFSTVLAARGRNLGNGQGLYVSANNNRLDFYGLSAGNREVGITSAGTEVIISVSGARDLGYFTHTHLGSNLDTVYLAGTTHAGSMTTAGLVTSTIYAVPFVLQKPNTISSILYKVTTAGTAAQGRMAIYDTSSNNNLYPANLVIDTSSVDDSVSGMKIFNVNLNTLTINKLYWLCINTSSIAASTYRAITISTAVPILGTDSNMSSYNYGFKISYAFGAFPSTFPSSASFLNSAPLPALGFTLT